MINETAHHEETMSNEYTGSPEFFGIVIYALVWVSIEPMSDRASFGPQLTATSARPNTCISFMSDLDD